MLEEASENTETILDNTPGFLVILNSENRVIRANKEFCSFVGKSMEECLHFNFEDIFTIENKNFFRHHIQLLKNEKNTDQKIDFKLDTISSQACSKPTTTDSSEDHSRQFFWQIFNNENKQSTEKHLITVVGRDLSESYRSEMKLLNIFSSIPLGMLIIDKNGHIKEVLSQYCEIIFGTKSLLGKDFQSLLYIPGDDEGRQIAVGFKHMLESIGDSKSNHIKNEHKFPRVVCTRKKTNNDNENIKWIKMSQQPVMSNGIVSNYILTLEDITETIFAKREIERVKLLEKQSVALYECAIRDPLSGLYTRLFMKDSVNSLVDSFHRGNINELSFVMFDIDYFKVINDTHGHSVGDSVIKKVGSIIKHESRESDIAVRYGGEEFIVVLPSKIDKFYSGAAFAERVRKAIEKTQYPLPNGKSITVTISAGIAYCKKNEPLKELINRADHYLYQAKNNGRNQCAAQEL